MEFLRRNSMAIVAALPLTLFIFYSRYESNLSQRMTFGSIVALPVLVYFAATRRWMSPILIGTYCFWILLYLAFALRPDWLVAILETLHEAGIFVAMVAAAILLAFYSRFGAAGLETAGRVGHVASAILIAAMALAIVPAVYFKGDETLAIVYPSIALVILQSLLYRLGTRKAA